MKRYFRSDEVLSIPTRRRGSRSAHELLGWGWMGRERLQGSAEEGHTS